MALSEYIIRYDAYADVLYVKIREGKVVESDEVENGIILDYDPNGNIIGIEILDFSKRKIDLNELVVKGPRVLVKT
ncbi:MAG: hypothetical protein C0200_00075 [Thermoproteota archaeon]|jgi:uncharacterized protein YuzE|nr:MAG: hypothetical protein C0200_00075 [Candidatus Korarchaeota archaeon]